MKHRLSFERGDHKDGNPFDGPGKKVGHAFLPPSGVVHLDEDEVWKPDGPLKRGERNFRQVRWRRITSPLLRKLKLEYSYTVG